MKKLVTLLAAAGMVVAASAPANAVDVKVDARYRFSFSTGETGFKGQNNEMAQQRLRLGLSMAASENLSGYFQFQAGKDKWGTTDTTAGHSNGTNLSVRQAYIDWTVPGTAAKVRMGRMGIGLPADAFGCNAAMDAGWGTREGIVVASPVTDNLGLSAFWIRAGYEAHPIDKHDLDTNKSTDIFAAIADLKFDGVKASVYGAYATIEAGNGTTDFNKAITEAGDAYWVGFTSTVSLFDPFTFALSAAYGSFEADQNSKADCDGWNVQAKASYKLGFGTPVLGAWYFSGMDKDGDGLMPSTAGYFAPTRTYHDGAKGLNGGQAYYLPSGNWGVQAGVEGMSFVSGLSHDFLVTYIQGTNDKAWAGCNSDEYLSEDDSFVSLDLINTYKIYKNLAAHLELSYIIADTRSEAKDAGYTEDDWRAELTFEYKF